MDQRKTHCQRQQSPLVPVSLDQRPGRQRRQFPVGQLQSWLLDYRRRRQMVFSWQQPQTHRAQLVLVMV